MAKPIIKQYSPIGTPVDEIMYVLELPTTSRIKFRKQDLEREIVQIDNEIIKKEQRKVELESYLTEVNKL